MAKKEMHSETQKTYLGPIIKLRFRPQKLERLSVA